LEEKLKMNCISRFVIYPATTLSPGMEPPGDIRFMDGSGEIRDREQFYPGER
jgi:hypothetical protein